MRLKPMDVPDALKKRKLRQAKVTKMDDGRVIALELKFKHKSIIILGGPNNTIEIEELKH